ncbi:MAG: 3-keto-5-aminohexanoate cleavage protein [Bacteroidetes bacterium]|nr:3-keto-5-aminohexanoate cleavage protein [Bacteroidota bacterium]
MTFVQAALNGDRNHFAVPKTPGQIAKDAKASVEAGAHSVHVHAFDNNFNETLDGSSCALVLEAIRRLCPDLPVSLTTSASIEPDPDRRLSLIKSWVELPDLVTINQGEEGILQLSEWFLLKGVEIEAGLLSVEDALKFVASPLRDHCLRVLIEPIDPDVNLALRNAAKMEEIVVNAGIELEQVHHGYDIACWAVNQRALARGHGIRTGLEDVAVLPNGLPAENNAQLVTAAFTLVNQRL